MNIVKAANPIAMWETLIEGFLCKKLEWFEEGVGYNLTDSLFSYDMILEVDNAKFDPQFDFGTTFGYTITKWTGLITNYLDLDVLDEAKTMIRKLEENKAVNRNYHIGFHFADNHGNGKGCLVGGIFSRKIGIDKPEITLMLRSSDIVTRLPMDLLLFSRFGEYVYGHTDFTMRLILKAAFANDTTILMYNKHKDIKGILANCEDEERSKKIRKSFKKIMKSEESVYKTYGNSFRAYKVLHGEEKGYNIKPLLAEKLEIGNWDGIPRPYPRPSLLKRNAIKKMFTKFASKYGFEGLEFKTTETKKKKLLSFSGVGEDDTDIPNIEDDDETQE